jgi:hypothetical protein
MSSIRCLSLLAALTVLGACSAVEVSKMSEPAVLRATFLPAPGVDAEYGQGAIERCEALHRPLPNLEWVIVDDRRRAADEWARCLNEAIGGKGRFRVEEADEALRRRVAAGEIELQR